MKREFVSIGARAQVLLYCVIKMDNNSVSGKPLGHHHWTWQLTRGLDTATTLQQSPQSTHKSPKSPSQASLNPSDVNGSRLASCAHIICT